MVLWSKMFFGPRSSASLHRVPFRGESGACRSRAIAVESVNNKQVFAQDGKFGCIIARHDGARLPRLTQFEIHPVRTGADLRGIAMPTCALVPINDCISANGWTWLYGRGYLVRPQCTWICATSLKITPDYAYIDTGHYDCAPSSRTCSSSSLTTPTSSKELIWLTPRTQRRRRSRWQPTMECTSSYLPDCTGYIF